MATPTCLSLLTCLLPALSHAAVFFALRLFISVHLDDPPPPRTFASDARFSASGQGGGAGTSHWMVMRDGNGEGCGRVGVVLHAMGRDVAAAAAAAPQGHASACTHLPGPHPSRLPALTCLSLRLSICVYVEFFLHGGPDSSHQLGQASPADIVARDKAAQQVGHALLLVLGENPLCLRCFLSIRSLQQMLIVLRDQLGQVFHVQLLALHADEAQGSGVHDVLQPRQVLL